MTTKNSPLPALQAQASQIANTMKKAVGGHSFGQPFDQGIADARNRGVFKTGVVMDDKVLVIEIPWKTIEEADTEGLAEFILNLMREKRPTVN